MTENRGEKQMSETGFLQLDPEYRELSKTVQEWALNGTQEEQECLALYFEKAMRIKLGLPCDPDSIIEKGVLDLSKISVSRYEEIKATAEQFVTRLFTIVNTTIDKTFEKAEAEAMQKLEIKITELEHDIDDKIEAKLAAKEPEYEKAIREGLGINPEMHVSDLNRYIDQLKKKRERN